MIVFTKTQVGMIRPGHNYETPAITLAMDFQDGTMNVRVDEPGPLQGTQFVILLDPIDALRAGQGHQAPSMESIP